MEEWRQELLKQSANYYATAADGKAWNNEPDDVMSSNIGYRLFRMMRHFEVGAFEDPFNFLMIPSIYRLGYAAALMDRLDGGCRIARHLELACKSVETQQGSLHLMFPAVYTALNAVSAEAATSQEYANEQALTEEEIEINGECKMRANRELLSDLPHILS